MKIKLLSKIIAVSAAVIVGVSTPFVVNANKEQEKTQDDTSVVAEATENELTESTTVEETTLEIETTTKTETTHETTTEEPITKELEIESLDSEDDNEIEIEEADILYFQGVQLSYDEEYSITSKKLTRSGGVAYYDGHKETWYSQKVLPGKGLKIPGRHVANDGTIRDEDGYICVAADPNYYSKGSKLMTSLGPAKVYDCGCAYGVIDVYVNW